jgi:hypothetical protein
MGFLDDAFGEDIDAFEAELRERARRLARDPEYRLMLRRKHERRLDDESIKPLASYRAEELERMRVNFFGPDPAYHEARRRFVFKGNPPSQRGQLPIEGEAEEASWVLSQGRPGRVWVSCPFSDERLRPQLILTVRESPCHDELRQMERRRGVVYFP